MAPAAFSSAQDAPFHAGEENKVRKPAVELEAGISRTALSVCDTSVKSPFLLLVFQRQALTIYYVTLAGLEFTW